jgi:hypothetical protein
MRCRSATGGLNLSLNTAKRYARTREPEVLRRAPRYRPTHLDPYRDHPPERRATNPPVPVLHPFREIKQLSYTASLNLLYRHITQGRAEGNRPLITPRRPAHLLLTHPDKLRDNDTQLLQELTAACPELSELARQVHSFAELPTPAKSNDAKLTTWITATQAADLPHLHSFTNGLQLDRDAMTARLTLPHHNGRTQASRTPGAGAATQWWPRSLHAWLIAMTKLLASDEFSFSDFATPALTGSMS